MFTRLFKIWADIAKLQYPYDPNVIYGKDGLPSGLIRGPDGFRGTPEDVALREQMEVEE